MQEIAGVDLLDQKFKEFLTEFYDTTLQWPFLVGAFLLAITFCVLSSDKSIKSIIKHIFNPKYWLHPSSIIDFKVGFINALIFTLLFPGVMFFSSENSIFIFSVLEEFFGTKEVIATEATVMGNVIFTLYVLMITDFLGWVYHYASHKVPSLWELHKLHHSAKVLTPFTTFRDHPLLSLMVRALNYMILGVVFAITRYVLNVPVSEYIFYGMNIFAFSINLFGGLLTHSNIKLQWPKPLAMLVVSPHNHQVHHSDQEVHYDKNFGFWLAIWDVMFGTFHYAKPEEQYGFGFEEEEDQHKDLKSAYIHTSKMFFKNIKTKKAS